MKLSAEHIELLMQEALIEAGKASSLGEVPVGAVIAIGGEIIARAHNLVEVKKDATAHAEVLAMQEAGRALGNWRLKDVVLCVTLEPCTMCIGAARLSRIPTIIFGANDPRMGAVGSLYDIAIDNRVGPAPRIIRGVREEECRKRLSSFFEQRRASTDKSRMLT